MSCELGTGVYRFSRKSSLTGISQSPHGRPCISVPPSKSSSVISVGRFAINYDYSPSQKIVSIPMLVVHANCYQQEIVVPVVFDTDIVARSSRNFFVVHPRLKLAHARKSERIHSVSNSSVDISVVISTRSSIAPISSTRSSSQLSTIACSQDSIVEASIPSNGFRRTILLVVVVVVLFVIP